MRILLVDPAPRSGITEAYEHLGLGSLSGVLRENGYDVRILSSPLQNASPGRMAREIAWLHPDILGFSVKEVNARRTLGLIRNLRRAGVKAHITLGGHFPTFNHRRLLQDVPEVDSIVRGEGEETLLEMARTLGEGGSLSGVLGLTCRGTTGIVENPPRPLIDNLDQLPFLSRDLTPEVIRQGGAIGMLASRGCYANCSFCSIRSFYDTSPGRAWRTRSPAHVAEEIEKLSHRFPDTPFKFFDDQFIGPGEKGREYALEIASEIQKRKLTIDFLVSCRVDAIEEDLFASLKEAGLKKVFLGLESGTQAGLDRFNKKTTVEQNKRALKVLDAVGLAYTIAFIFFDPYSTMRDVTGNLEFLSEIRPHWQGKKGILSIEPSLTVHKGTPIEKRLRQEGRLLGDYLGYRYRIEDRRVQMIRTLADWFVRRVQPSFHQLKFTGRSMGQKMRAAFSSLSGPPGPPREARYHEHQKAIQNTMTQSLERR